MKELHMYKEIIFAVDSYIKNEDGYKTRIDFEINILKDKYKIFMLIDESIMDGLSNPYHISYVPYKSSVSNKRATTNNRNAALQIFLRDHNNAIVYLEALEPAIKLYHTIKNINNIVVFDCHGATPYEYRMNHGKIAGMLGFCALKWYENKVLAHSNLLVTVTKEQQKLLNYNCTSTILPMIPGDIFLNSYNNQKENIRDSLKIDERYTVFVYSGNTSKWQMCEDTIKLYKNIENIIDNAFLLVCTKDKEYFANLVEKYDIKHFRIITAKYNEMPNILDGCNYGFCLRDNDVVNKVASPTKVLEYMARGVIPIISNYVGDFSHELKDNNLGIITDFNVTNLVKKINTRDINVNEVKNYALRSTEVYKKEYIEALKNIENKNV